VEKKKGAGGSGGRAKIGKLLRGEIRVKHVNKDSDPNKRRGNSRGFSNVLTGHCREKSELKGTILSKSDSKFDIVEK